jgi:hypothetical protein
MLRASNLYVASMTGDNFVERVHAYSKWLLDLEDSGDLDSAPSIASPPRLTVTRALMAATD